MAILIKIIALFINEFIKENNYDYKRYLSN